MRKLVIGITGGIGSGKSTVTNYLLKNGYECLIADNIAKEIMVTDENVISSIISRFGHECYIDKKLNTQIIADKVFKYPEEIKILNSIVHPPTISKIEKSIDQLKQNHSLVFVESALIFEAKMEYLFDYVLLISAEDDTRIKRVLERGGETISEIRSRMLNQIPEDLKKKRAQFIIENDSSLTNLEEKIHFFLNLFKSLVSNK